MGLSGIAVNLAFRTALGRGGKKEAFVLHSPEQLRTTLRSSLHLHPNAGLSI
jgi:hypothetical protein